VNDGTPAESRPKKKKQILFFNARAPRKGKEAGPMPPMAGGTASPWFTGRAQKPDDGENEPNYILVRLR
jgi:hypothetical protein